MTAPHHQYIRDALDGVNAVLITPFRDGTGPVDVPATTRLAQACDAAGIHAVTALGNTAEPYQLTAEERLTVLRAVAEDRGGALRVAGLPGSLSEAAGLAETAAGLGYDAVMLHEPLDPLAGDAGILAFLTAVADASPLPCVAYVRTPRMSRASIAALVRHPNVAGIKYARPTELGLLASLMADPEVRDACAWACGSAESMVPAMRPYGLRGFTSGLANLRPDLALGVWRASTDGDLGLLQQRVNAILPFELMRTREGSRHNVSVVKWALRYLGTDAGDVRPPCDPLEPQMERELEKLIDTWGAR